MDVLGVPEPVDWVGNAWGGHVGLVLGTRAPERPRTLVTVATPAHALTRSERTKIVPMVWTYRLVGPVAPLAAAVVRVLLGAAFMKSRPEDTRLVLRSFRDAPKTGMLRAIESVILKGPDITPLLSGVEVRL
jgi:pimeloyl-ACP methyl ester carboxylesterase